MSTEPIKVTVSDPITGEVLAERVLDNDYTIICAGDTYLANTQTYANGTHMLTVKRSKENQDA